MSALRSPRGRRLGIIGPNGAGKSTLFNLITGNFLPDAGQITFLGRDVTRIPAMERVRVGVGPQLPDPATLRGADRLREPACRRRLRPGQARGRGGRRRASRSCGDTGILRARPTSLPAPSRLLDRKRLELARAMATGAGAPASRRNRRRPDRGRMPGAGRHDPRPPRARRHDHLDRACPPCADFASSNASWCSTSDA